MCLDWLGQHDEAALYFRKALELDPNFWQTRAMMGWHEFQMEHFKEASDWMLESIKVNWSYNTIAPAYLALAQKMIARENATRH
jgi:tetratricopeptide (TPR) repeat protein